MKFQMLFLTVLCFGSSVSSASTYETCITEQRKCKEYATSSQYMIEACDRTFQECWAAAQA